MVLFIGLLSYGQRIEGVELGSQSDKVVSDLTRQGFTKSKTNSQFQNAQEFLGYFDGEQVSVILFSMPKSNLVYKIILTKREKNWEMTKKAYENYKVWLVKNYGKPINEQKYFLVPHYDGDGMEMKSLYVNRTVLETIWPDMELKLYSDELGVGKISYMRKDMVLSLLVDGDGEKGF